MKKILFALLCTFPFLFAGCAEESTTTGGGNITPPPTETNLTVSGVSEEYFIPIADATSSTPRAYSITFYISNNTANTYNNVQITPVFTDENNHILTAADGLNYTVGIENDPKDFTIGSLHTATIRITYTGTQKMNVKFQVEVSSDNMPTEKFSFNTANFLSHLQAFLYTNDGTSESITPITADTIVQSTTTSNIKIIFKISMTINGTATFKVMLKGSTSGSGTVDIPLEPLTLQDKTTISPCSAASSPDLFYVRLQERCYVEIQPNSTDKWTYNFIGSSGAETTPSGYKPTDAINIQVQ